MRPAPLDAGSISVSDPPNTHPLRVVFDCNIFVQSLLSPIGPAGACVQHALDRHIELFLSQYILDELNDAPAKPTPAKLGITPPECND